MMFILAVVVVGILVWVITAIIAALPMSEPFKRVATVLTIVWGVLTLLKLAFPAVLPWWPALPMSLR